MKVPSYVTMVHENGAPYLVQESAYDFDGRCVCTNQETIAEFIRDRMLIHKRANESVWILCLDNRLHITGCFEAARGGVGECVISPREIMQNALLAGATTIILSHNHPGGDPTPSELDIALTKAVAEAGDVVGVRLVDHIIISRFGDWISMCEQNLILK